MKVIRQDLRVGKPPAVRRPALVELVKLGVVVGVDFDRLRIGLAQINIPEVQLLVAERELLAVR